MRVKRFAGSWHVYLAGRYTVIAVDLRGIGKSQTTRADYDAETQAQDIHELTSQLAITDPYIVAHDMGGMIGYAYARLYPSETRGVAILDGPLPGTPKLPERLIGGRVYPYFKRAFFLRFVKDKQAMTDADMRHYASAYQILEQLRAGLGLYQTYRKNQAFMKAHRGELQVPIILLKGDYGSGKPGPTAKELANQFGCRNVTAQVVVGCGHFMADKQPHVIADLLHNQAR